MNIQHSEMEPDYKHSNLQAAKYNKGRPVKLLLEATHAFCRFERPNQTEIQIYKEFFYSLIDQITMLEKREISIVLARNHYTPRPVAIHLALGEVAGSTPMLLFSPVLKEVDLVAIAGKCPIAGIRVLARRDGLTSRIMKAIDAREDAIATRILHLETNHVSDVVQRITANKDQKKALPKTEQVSTTDDPAPIRQQQELLDLASRGGRLGKNKSEITTVFFSPSGGFAEELTEAARNRDVDAFCLTVYREIFLDVKVVSDMLSDTNPEGLCKLLKAMKIPNSKAAQILLLLNKEIGASVKIFRSAMAGFDQLSVEKCQQEFFRSGAKFHMDGESFQVHATPPSISGMEPNNHASKLESALRRRQEALGQQVRRPLFNNSSSKTNTAA